MQLLSQVISFSRSLLRRQQTEKDLDDEILSHLDLLSEQKRKQGVTPEEAHRVAGIEIGGVEQIKQEVRQLGTGAWLDTLPRDAWRWTPSRGTFCGWCLARDLY